MLSSTLPVQKSKAFKLEPMSSRNHDTNVTVSKLMYNSSKMPRTFGRSARTPRPPRTAPAGKHRRPHTARGPTISAKGLTMKIIMMKSKKKFVALDAKMEEISRRFATSITGPTNRQFLAPTERRPHTSQGNTRVMQPKHHELSSMYRNFQKRTRFHDQSARFRQWYNNIAHSSRRIFQAKCNDMCMPISARREELFIQTVLEFCVNSSFSVQDSGLGPLAAREIARFMRKQYVLSQQKNNTFTHLNLGGNSLGDEGVHCLTHMLRKNLHLTTLDLHSNACSSIGFASVFDALTHDNHTLTTLDISATSTKNKMYIGPGITGVLALKRMLIHNNNLTTLNIANVGLGLIPGGMQLVSDGLAMNKTLTNLDLSMNNINHYEVNILTKGIKKAEASMLQSLTLRGNKLGSLGASHVANLLRHSTGLTKLDLAKNEIGIAGWVLLSDATATNTAITRLIMDHNHLGTKPHLSYLLEQRAKVPEVAVEAMMAELDKYHLKNRYVTNRLGSNETLRALSLNGCGLRDRFASQLFEVLESNEALTALSLGRNVLKAESAERLAALLQTNKGLKMVSLHSNNIDDDGGVALVEALMTNKTLHEIDLRNNDLGERTAEELVEMLSENRNIIQCSVDGNKMPYRMYKKVCEFVTKNKQVYDAGITVRQETLVEKLELEEKQLSHTQKSIALHEDLERRTFRDLSEIDGSRIDFKLDQRHRTKELEMTLEGTTHESYEVRQRMYDMAQKLKQTRSISMAREARVNEAIKKEKAVSKDLHFQRQKAKDRMIKIRDSPSPLDEEIQQLTHVRNQEQRRIKGDQRELVRELENVRALVANMEARLKSKLVAKNDNAERGGRRVSSVGGLQRSRGAAIRKKKVSKGRSPRKKQSIKKKASRRK